MSGALWALTSGVGFGLFQTLNRRAVRGLDVYLSTFLQIAQSAAVLVVIATLTEGLGPLRRASGSALASFTAAGLVHFFAGWTLLNASQKRIGAARTSSLISTVPLFATVVAVFALREVPRWPAVVGIVLVAVGVLLVSRERPAVSEGPAGDTPPAWRPEGGWRGILCGLGTAACWSVSPIFIRHGLAGLPSPLLGLTVGLVASGIAYGAGLLVRRRGPREIAGREVLLFKTAAGVLIALSQWGRFIALSLAPVGVVLSLTQVSVPVVMVLSPVLAGRHLEHVTARVWVGATVIVGGSLVLVWTR